MAAHERCIALQGLAHNQFMLPTATQASRLTPTAFRLAGELSHFQPLDSSEYVASRFSRQPNITQLDEANVVYSSLQDRERLRINNSSNSTLRIVVLGVSPTAGCGGAEAYGLLHNESTAKLSPICDPSRGWPRRLQDLLDSILEPVGVKAELNVWAKNAQHANFFAQCAHSRVPRDTDMILIEFANNVWGADVDHIVHTIRKAAPEALVAFVVWSNQRAVSQVQAAIRNSSQASQRCATSPGEVEEIDRVAATQGLDVIRVDCIIAWLISSGASFSDFYAKRGSDTFHPNPAGHALIAGMRVRLVATHVSTALCSRSDHELDRALLLHTTKSVTIIQRGTDTSGKGVVDKSVWNNIWEQCFDRADMLPVRTPLQGWALVDDGARKGVQKLGYASELPGASLSIGPLPMPAGYGCVWMWAKLGYLLSSLEGQGTFSLRCAGCNCTHAGPARAVWYRKKNLAFPLVSTDARRSGDGAIRAMSQVSNISITAMTEFYATIHADRECFLDVTHEIPYVIPQHEGQRSRVRIDYLTLRPAVGHDVHMMRTRFGSGEQNVLASMNCSVMDFSYR